MSHADGDAVAAALERWCAPGQLLSDSAWAASWRMHGLGESPHGSVYVSHRMHLHEHIIERYLSEHDGTVPRDGYAAIATAGPPGAGKSTAIDNDPTFKSWRRIDADRVKTLLIENDVLGPNAQPAYRDFLDINLPDGGTVMPMELAGLVHHESTRIADDIARRCRADGENLVIEGTLGWDGQAIRLAIDFAIAGYESLRVALVETDQDTALERARERWWSGRMAGHPGGRFTPRGSIIGLYDLTGTPTAEPDDQTKCAAHARLLIAEARSRHMDADLL